MGPLRKTVRIFELADDFLLGTELTTEEGIVEADEDHMVNLVVQNQSHSMVRLHMENILGQLQDVEVLPEGCPEVSVNLITPQASSVSRHFGKCYICKDHS